MMRSICGSDCCTVCPQKTACGGCRETGGHPFGGVCVAAACVEQGGPEAFSDWKRSAVEELNALSIPDLHIGDLIPLNGFYGNLEYHLPNGQAVKLLEDSKVYLGAQIERPGQERCYGVVADEKYLLVCEYGCNGADPEIVCYKRRQQAGQSSET